MRTMIGALMAALAMQVMSSNANAVVITNSITVLNGPGANSRCGPSGAIRLRGNEPASAPYSSSGGGCEVTGDLFANDGKVGIQANMSLARGAATATSGVRFVAESQIARIFIEPLLGQSPRDLIRISVNAEQAGNVRATLNTSSNFGRGAGASLDSKVTLIGQRGGAAKQNDTRISLTEIDAGAGNTDPEDFDEILFNSVSTGSVRHEPEEPLKLIFRMEGFVFHGTFGDSSATANISALNSLGFPTSGPIFNFFDDISGNAIGGFTVNIPELGIADNRLVSAVVAVPEPAALSLFGTGLLALLGFAGWSRKRAAAA